MPPALPASHTRKPEQAIRADLTSSEEILLGGSSRTARARA